MKILIFVIAMLTLPHSIQVQNTNWQLILAYPSENKLLVLTENGIEKEIDLSWLPITISEGVTVSENLTKLAFSDQNTIQIADLEAKTCCTGLPFREEKIEWDFDSLGKRMVVSYLIDKENGNSEGGMVIYDIETVEVLHQINSTSWGEDIALHVDWQGNHIRFLPSCYKCEPPLRAFYWHWNPDTQAVTETDLFYTDDYWGDVLETNGDLILTERNTSYPLVGDYAETKNVVGYYSAFGEQESGHKTVFFGSENEYVASPRWVLDGQAFLIDTFTLDNTKQTFLVHRDGTQILVDDTRFLVGTLDGWLATTPDFTLIHYTYTKTTGIQTKTLGEFSGFLLVLNPPLLGSSITEQKFTEIAHYDWGEPLCEGFLPSRLNVGGQGRVTEGAANNLRAEPTTESEKLGEIPGGDSFVVVGGPACTPDMTWWQVEYRDMMGWTAEGQGNTYWVEHWGTQH